MSNALAIAQKELKSYFASPIAYIVIGVFAFLYGYFYVVMLNYFVQASMQSFGTPGQPMNVNEQMLRVVFQNVAVVILFLMPIITMRTYAEEKRSGTIELLLTAPVTDWQIIIGKFLGAMGLYAAMLAVTVVHIVVLFWFGDPEWKPIVTSYLGLFLMGGCFISVGLLISSFTKNQIVAGAVTFAVFLFLWIIGWIGGFSSPAVNSIVTYISIIDHFEDFSKGVIDTSHLVYYLSFIGFGLFLTARSVDSERWRG